MNQKGLYPMQQMNIRIEARTKEELENMARNDKRSLSDYVRIILEEYVQRHGISKG